MLKPTIIEPTGPHSYKVTFDFSPEEFVRIAESRAASDKILARYYDESYMTAEAVAARQLDVDPTGGFYQSPEWRDLRLFKLEV